MSLNERIAIIDDDMNLRKTLADILTHYGYAPLVYQTGQSAMEEIIHQFVGVALLDLRLEDCSGLEVLRFIKEHSPDTACIILTGNASQDSAIEAVNAGAYSYFLKPVNIEQLLVTIRRALEKRQADIALLESERHYQALADVSPVGIFRTDALGNTTYVNPRWSLIAGIPPEQAWGMGWLSAVHPEDRQNMLASWQNALKVQQDSVADYRFLRNDGSVSWVIGQALPERNTAGQLTGYIGTITDITVRKEVEDALLRSEAQYRLITDHIEDVVWQLDQNLRFSYVSPAVESVLGYTTTEVCELVITDLLDADGLIQMRAVIQAHLGQDSYSSVTPTEYRMKHKNGQWVEVEVVSSPVYNFDRKIMGFVGVTRDISERKRIEQTLLENEQRIKRHIGDLEVLYENGLKLTRLYDRQEIAECIIGLLGEQLNWHHAVLRLLNAEQEEMEVLGFSHTKADPKQTNEEYQRLKATPIKPGVGLTGWALQNGLVVRTGSLLDDPRYLETFAGMQSGLYVPMMTADQVLGVISVESENPNAFNEEDERLLVTLAAQAAASFDNARLYAETIHRLEELEILVQVSAALRTASGRTEMLPVILDQTMAVLHADGAAFAFRSPTTNEIVYELGAGDLAGMTQVRVPAGQGIAGWVLGTGQLYVCQDVNIDPLYHPPIKDFNTPKTMVFAPLISQDQVNGVLLVGSQNLVLPNQTSLLRTIANIAANAIQRASLHEQTLNYAAVLEQRVEERTAELRNANTALECASRSKDEFLASMSHELRTPLSGILNMSEILQEQIYGPLNEKQLHYMRIVEESGRHLLSLINDILDLTKIDAGQLDLQFDMVQINLVCHACLQLTRGLAHKKNQTVSYSIFPPDINLRADTRRLKQMMVNLLGNAVKFTPPGGKIGLEVSGDEQNQVIHISVWDTGIGIDQEDFTRLFQPFTQLDASLSRQHEGTGLGLAIVQRLADKHGGSISLESTPGQGSRFTIHLPWITHLSGFKNGLLNTPPTNPQKKAPPAIALAKDRNPFRLLLVDDNQVNIQVYAEYLRQFGYKVILAGNGQEALELVYQERPQLILMDLQMPGMDGLTAIRQLRAFADQTLAHIPVIALTALAMSGDRERSLQAGANDYLSKPVSLRDLLRVIETYLK